MQEKASLEIYLRVYASVQLPMELSFVYHLLNILSINLKKYNHVLIDWRIKYESIYIYNAWRREIKRNKTL